MHPVPKNDWDRAPWNRWSFQHVRELLPTTEVWRGRGKPWDLPNTPVDLDTLRINPSPDLGNSDSHPQTIEDWLGCSYTDGFIVMHRGCIVFERYMNNMSDRTLHLSQSVAKSIVGTVAGIMMDKGLLNADERLSVYWPELANTAWKDATVQQSMDMTTGVRFIEDYTAPDSDIAMTDIACGWKPAREGINAPACMREQILNLKQITREHGIKFEYRSIETDVLAHCMEHVSGIPLAELVSRELWQPLGCEESACFTIDSAGYALADGGFNATLRDYARFGLLHAQQGFANGQQIVSKEWIQDISNANAELFGEPYTHATPQGAYRNQHWIEDASKSAYMARGVFGQLIYIDRDNDFVAVKLSSWPEFTSVPRLRQALDAIASIKTFVQATA